MHPRTRKQVKRSIMAGSLELAVLVGISAACFIAVIALTSAGVALGRALGLLQ